MCPSLCLPCRVTEELGAIDLFDIYAATCTERFNQADLSVQAMARTLAGAPGGLAARIAANGEASVGLRAAPPRICHRRVDQACLSMVKGCPVVWLACRSAFLPMVLCCCAVWRVPGDGQAQG